MAANTKAKTRKVNNPYEVYFIPGTEWEWRVLKHYQTPEKEAANPYARTFCAVRGDGTFGGYDLGDTYIKDYTTYAVRVPDHEVEEWCASDPWKEY